jgi:beta-lactamase class D
MKEIIVVIILIITLQIGTPAQTNPFDSVFKGHKAAFVLYDYNNDEFFYHDSAKAAERFLPASTFKVVNSLIGLETGVIKDEHHTFKWDSTKHPIESWNRDHDLASAIKNSVVWYYQRLAREVGRKRMQSFLNTIKYGNREIGTKIDQFWLDGSLQISAIEQGKLLVRLYESELPFSERNIRLVKEIMKVEENDEYILRGKTGLGRINQNNYLGWFIGYLEKESNVYFFAINLEGDNFSEMIPLRLELAKKALASKGVIVAGE